MCLQDVCQAQWHLANATGTRSFAPGAAWQSILTSIDGERGRGTAGAWGKQMQITVVCNWATFDQDCHNEEKNTICLDDLLTDSLDFEKKKPSKERIKNTFQDKKNWLCHWFKTWPQFVGIMVSKFKKQMQPLFFKISECWCQCNKKNSPTKNIVNGNNGILQCHVRGMFDCQNCLQWIECNFKKKIALSNFELLKKCTSKIVWTNLKFDLQKFKQLIWSAVPSVFLWKCFQSDSKEKCGEDQTKCENLAFCALCFCHWTRHLLANDAPVLWVMCHWRWFDSRVFAQFFWTFSLNHWSVHMGAVEQHRKNHSVSVLMRPEKIQLFCDIWCLTVCCVIDPLWWSWENKELQIAWIPSFHAPTLQSLELFLNHCYLAGSVVFQLMLWCQSHYVVWGCNALICLQLDVHRASSCGTHRVVTQSGSFTKDALLSVSD